MKILKNNKDKSGFKGILIKIGLVALAAFMIFGAMRSCIKVNAEVLQLESNEMYGWTINKVNGQYPRYYIGNIFAEFDSTGVSFEAVYSCSNMFTYGGVSYNRIVVSSYVYNNGLNMNQLIYYQTSPIGEQFIIYRADSSRPSLSYPGWDIDSESFTEGVSPYFIITNTNITLTVTGVTGTFTVSDTLYPYLTYVSNNTGYDLYQQGYTYGYNKAMSDFNTAQYWSNGYNTGYDDGYTAGLNDPYNPLLGQGYSEGYTAGYNAGYDDSPNNPYTFKDLIFAVFEVPVSVFSGLFNFDFLGFNLKDFVFAVLTLSVMVFILRKLVF